ncbi:MAG: DUF459 domain-containing protein [Thermodesulfobacteriota bacterium]
MRVSAFLCKVFAVAAVIALTGCAGASGEAAASAKSSRNAAKAALQKPRLGSDKLFDLPKRRIQTLAVTGDSLSIGMASELEKNLSPKPGLAIVKLGRVSSGLARPEFFDWNRHMETLASKHRPDAVVVMLGANDNKRMTVQDGSLVHFGTREWDRIYKERVRRIVGIIRSHNSAATVFWLGAPVMADEALSRDLRHINALVRKVMASMRDCHYVDTWDLFAAPGGGFAFAKPDVEGGQTLRSRDGVHLTAAGSQALAARCQGALETRITWDQPGMGKDSPSGKGV